MSLDCEPWRAAQLILISTPDSALAQLNEGARNIVQEEGELWPMEKGAGEWGRARSRK